MDLSPSWAMSGQAINGAGDTHLVEGRHYRIVTNPLLGLPVAPLVVWRLVLSDRDLKAFGKTRVTWVDSHGTILTTPFTVTPDNPVTGHLPLGAGCCWARVRGWAGATPAPGPVDPRPPVVRPILKPPRPDLVRLDPRDRLPIRGTAKGDGLRVEGRIATPYGDAPVAVRSAPPYDVYASHLERIVVSGSGEVRGIQWLSTDIVLKLAQDAKLQAITPLPTRPGPRYAALDDGYPAGIDRATAGAPTRLGMHESPAAAAPTGCDPVGPGDETTRVEQLAATLVPVLDRLVNDLSAAQTALVSTDPVVDANGVTLGSTSRPLLGDVLQSAVDPGLARWLGFLDVDLGPVEPDWIMIYLVGAAYAPDWSMIDKLALRGTLPPVIADPVEAVRKLIEGTGFDAALDAAHELQTRDHVVMGVVLAATVAAPLDLPTGPLRSVTASTDWLPERAPAARREVTARLADLVAGAGLASAIAQPSTAAPTEHNPRDTVGRRRLLTAGRDPAVTGATDGELRDRSADDQDGSWQVAQSDWFGRWSRWTRRAFPAGVRPRPPRPVLTVTSAPPTVPTPVPTTPLAGTARIEIAVPPVSGLPPGARLLGQLELTTRTGGGAPAVTLHPVTAAAPPEQLVITVPGPALAPTASGTVVVTARWLDTAGVASDPSDPRTATLHDPRPPVPVSLPASLTYTARPDATGHAEATLEWSSSPDQAYFRVFVADETTMRAKLGDIAAGRPSDGDAGQAPTPAQATAVLAALDAVADPALIADRGAVWAANRHLLPRRWWLQLTSEPLPRNPAGSTRFTHSLSGSLAVLALYRVVAVSAASVESDFATAPLLPRGVPNALSPSVPAVTVSVVSPDPGGTGQTDLHAVLTVDVPLGSTRAVRYRVRRGTASSDPALMQVVATGTVPATTGDRQVFTVTDTGSGPQGPRTSLRPWLRYHWRVEVQGAPAPGSGPDGEWSRPSAAASTVMTPPRAPAPVETVTVTREAGAVHVRFGHPEPLAGGATTGYLVDVYRQLPGQQLRLLASVPGQEPPPRGRGTIVSGDFDVVDGDPAAAAGTSYRVIVTDPIGRTSAPSVAVTAP